MNNKQIEFFELVRDYLPGRKVVMLHLGKEKMKISLMNNAIGSDIQGQKENVEMFCQIVSNLG